VLLYSMVNRYKTGSGPGAFRKVTCAQTGEEVSRRKSLAIGYKGDGACGSPAPACKRVKRELAPKQVVLSSVEIKPKVIKKVIDTPRKEIVPVAPLSSRQKAQVKKLLDRKRNEDKKST